MHAALIIDRFPNIGVQLLNIGKVLLRYGLGARHLDAYVDAVLSKFTHIYDLQSGGATFNNVTTSHHITSHHITSHHIIAP